MKGTAFARAEGATLKARISSVLSRLVLAGLRTEPVEQRLWEIVNAPRSFRRRAGNLEAELARRATKQTAAYVERRMGGVPRFRRRFDLLRHALSKSGDGLYLEFGVASGKSINFIADERQQETIHGFDSFEGLPERWLPERGAGAYSRGGQRPAVRSNVRLHVGWFVDVLPAFLAEHPGQIAFMHVDCDLYLSTKAVFAHVGERIRPGTVIQFDEYFNYPGWRHHEFRAFQEVVEERRLRYEYIGYHSVGYSAAVLIR